MTTTCPTAETLLGLLRGGLEPDQADSVRDHLDRCADCIDALDHLSDDPELDRWMADGPDDGLEARRLAFDGLRSGPARRPSRPDLTTGPPTTLGPYTIEAEVGRGGMGIVYRARDRTIGRLVALKVLRPERVDDRARARFVREVRAAATVEHDHVVRVYGTSDPSDPTLYFAMEYLAGPSLAGQIRDRGRLDPREAAAIVAQVADGLAAAHGAGLVHRDVKPGNILIDASTGRAKVGDFGLARLASEAGETTADGLIAGTPAYLSPEQARGEPDVDSRTDVYALGVTLYECLAGECPFRGSPHRIIHQILDDDPRPPTTLNDALPRDLETVCLKAMAKEPTRRYETTAEFAADLRRFLNGEPIRARSAGRLERVVRLARRKPLAAGLISALAIVVLVGSVAATILWRRAERNAARSRANLAVAQEHFRQARAVVDTLYTKVSAGGDLGQHGLEHVRGDVVRDVLRYYREFQRLGGDDPALLAELAEAAFRIGQLTSQTGDQRDSLAAYRDARERYDAIARGDPGNLAARMQSAKCLIEIGALLERLGRTDEALEAHREACAVLRRLVAERPDNLEVHNKFGTAVGSLANTYAARGEGAIALPLYREAREQFEAIGRLDPANPRWREHLSMTLHNMAEVVLDKTESLLVLHQALALREGLAQARPEDFYLRRNVGRTRQRIGGTLAALGRHEEAIDSLQAARQILDKALSDGPTVLIHQGDLAECSLNLAGVFLEVGRAGDALASANEAIRRLEYLSTVDSKNMRFREYLADGHRLAALSSERLGRPDEALHARRARLEVLRGLNPIRPDGDLLRAEIAAETRAIADLVIRLGSAANAPGKPR